MFFRSRLSVVVFDTNWCLLVYDEFNLIDLFIYYANLYLIKLINKLFMLNINRLIIICIMLND